MKTALTAVTFALALGMASLDSDAARRFGGGGNLGKQRPAPAQNVTKEAPAAAPAAPAATPASAAAAKPGAPAAQPTFMQRWGGLLAGLGIGVLLASLFGAELGPIIGMLLLGLLAAGVIYMLFRVFASRGAPPSRPAQFAGLGSAAAPVGSRPEVRLQPASGAAAAAQPARKGLGPDEIQAFLRVAKTSFIRLQAANDARDLDDIRDYTTPEMYAEIAMQLNERGAAPQKTEVVSVDAQLLDNVVEGDHAIASVRFTGLIRENDARNPEPFDEVWHVRKNLRERNGSWQIAGIQQSA